MAQDIRNKDVRENRADVETTPRITMVREPEAVRERMTERVHRPLDVLGNDLVHWGSIWGGVFMFLAFASILSALAIAIGGIPATFTAGVGATVGTILILSTFLAAFFAGWTNNVRSVGPSIVNGLIFASLLASLPLLLTSVAAGVALAPAGPINLTGPAIALIRANLVVFSVGTILMLAAGALGFWAGMRAHLADLDRIERRDVDRRI